MSDIFAVILRPGLPSSLRQVFDKHLYRWEDLHFVLTDGFDQKGFFVEIAPLEKDNPATTGTRKMLIPADVIVAMVEIEKGKERNEFPLGFQ